MFGGFDFTNFWEDSAYALEEYVSKPPSDELIASVEQELGYKLPSSYIWLMKRPCSYYRNFRYWEGKKLFFMWRDGKSIYD